MSDGPTRAVVLCADDYGLNRGTSRAILDLAAAGRISATSCMTNAPTWPAAAAELRDAPGRIGRGLHLTLTWGRPLGPMPRLAAGGALPSLRDLLGLCMTGRAPGLEIEAEIERQLGRFRDAIGSDPDFVDGHQHAHVLPGIRGPLLRVLRRADLAGRIWLRDPGERMSAILRRSSAAKAATVRGFATGFGRQARRAGFSTNRGFSGFSDFSGDVEATMGAAFRSLGPAPLVMCHPGHADAADPDQIEAAREAEFAYLASPAFGGLLAAEQIRLVPAPLTAG